MRYLPLIFTLVFATPTSALELIAELPDGRKVVLSEDFTWHFLDMQQKKIRLEAKTATAIPQTTLAATKQTAPVLQAKTNQGSGLLTTLTVEQSDVYATLDLQSWLSGKNSIPVTITNNSLESVIVIDMQVSLFDTEGKRLYADVFQVWRSIKRMPDTYLRKGQTQTGIEIKLNTPASKVARAEAKITEIVFR